MESSRFSWKVLAAVRQLERSNELGKLSTKSERVTELSNFLFFPTALVQVFPLHRKLVCPPLFLSCDKRNKSWYLKEFIFGVMKRYKCIVNCIWMSLVAPLVVPYWEVIIRLWVGLMGLGSNLKMWPEIDLSGIRKQQIINSIVWLTEDLDARLARWGREIPPSDLHLQFFFWILSAWRRQYSIRELLESSKSLSPIYARWNFQPRTI